MKMNAADLQSGMAQCTGTTEWHRHGLARNFLMTDGVIFLAENAGAHWLTDVVASHVSSNAALRKVRFQMWTLVVTDSKGVVTANNGHTETAIVTQDISWTDFPLSKIDLYCAYDEGLSAWVLMLPSEY